MNNLGTFDNVCVLRMHIAKAERMGRLRTIEARILDDGDSIITTERVQHSRAYAATSRSPRNQQRVTAEKCQITLQRRAVKGARLLLLDNDILGLGGNLTNDRVGVHITGGLGS